jgi:multidrug efflux pump subunit AcrA (membrane-fusion protein)
MVQLVARVPSDATNAELSVGLFVTAEISGLAVDNVVSLPRSAMRNDNRVLIVDGDNKLRFRKVKPLRLYKDNVLIQSGLQQGDRVCLTTIQTAIDGMPVIPVAINADLAQRG